MSNPMIVPGDPGNSQRQLAPWTGEMELAPEPEAANVQQLLAMLFRCRKLFLGTFLTVVLLVGVYTWASKPVYEATASLLVDSTGGRSVGASQLPLLQDLQELTSSRSVETQAEIIKSPTIEHAALARLSARDRAALDGAFDVKVASKMGNELITVSATSHSPRAAAALSNAICNQYMTANQTANREQTHAAAEYVSRQMDSVRQRLDRAQVALKHFKEKNLSIDLAEESKGKIGQLAQVESGLLQARADRQAAVAQQSALREIMAKMAPDEIASTQISPTPIVDQIKSELTKLELARTEAIQEYRTDSPEVSRLDRQISDIHQRLGREAQTEIRTQLKAVNPVRQAVAQELATGQGQIWALEARTKALQTAITRSRADLSRLPEQEYRMAELTTEAGVLQQTFQMLNEEYQRLRISEEARLSSARIVVAATPPKSPIKPRKMLNMLAAVALGLMLGFGLAAMVDRVGDRMHSEDDVEMASGRPVIGLIPRIDDDTTRSLALSEHRNTALLESFRMLRSNVNLSLVDEPVRSVLVTSSEIGVGKSFTCANLAVAMALDGKQVVLVDCDLRRPSIHKFFGVENKLGLTSVVSGNATIEEVLQEVGVPGLRLLASGPLPPNPPELLNSRAFRVCLDKILEIADFVILDSPPSLVMVDAQVLSPLVDGILLVVSAGESHRRLLTRVSSMLGQVHARILGVVINKLDTGPGGYYGYYGYSRYHYYNKYHSNYGSPELPESADSSSGSRG